MSVEGVDYSYGRPDPAKLAGVGKVFACRYLTIVNDSTRGKLLTRAEADELHAAGIATVSNWEYAAGDARGGRPAGVTYASAADVQHHAAGGPPDRPIYFSVDWDATPADLAGPVRAYFEGIASVLGVERTGAYGGVRTIDYLLDHKLIGWAWQTYAWSGGKWDTRAHIQQYRNGVSVAGGDCDLDRAMTADYGQWGDDMAERIIAEFGDTGEGIKELQRDMDRLGYPCGPTATKFDGNYGATMQAAVKKFRTERLDASQVGSGKTFTGWHRSQLTWELMLKAAKDNAVPGPKGDPGVAGPAGTLPPGTRIEFGEGSATVASIPVSPLMTG